MQQCDLLPPLCLRKRSGKVVLERSELGKSLCWLLKDIRLEKKQAICLVQEDDASSLASWTLPLILEAHITGALEEAKALTWDHQLDQGNGST